MTTKTDGGVAFRKQVFSHTDLSRERFLLVPMRHVDVMDFIDHLAAVLKGSREHSATDEWNLLNRVLTNFNKAYASYIFDSNEEFDG